MPELVFHYVLAQGALSNETGTQQEQYVLFHRSWDAMQQGAWTPCNEKLHAASLVLTSPACLCNVLGEVCAFWKMIWFGI